MSEKSKSVRPAQSRTDTLIGADLRVEGNITSTGVLRIQGDVHGDVSCDADSGGTIVVGKSGNITGSVKAPHIVVSGHVSGPLHSAESIEIQEGACVVGDAFYKAIDIHAGGVLEGTLTPGGLPEGDRLQQEHRIQMPEPAARDEHDMPPADAAAAGDRQGARFGGWRKLGAASALLVAVLAVVLLKRGPAPVAPAAGDVASAADSATKGTPAAQAVPAASGGLPDGPKAVAGDAAPLVPGPDANARSGAQDAAPDTPEADPDKVVRVQGVNPGKPAGFFLLIGKEPTVLFRKKRKDPGEGKRIGVSQGATVSIPIAKDEIIRVAQGRDIEIFYQGRKVAPKTIESGAWMSFVPQLPDGAIDRP
ncbi:MAG: polymer-forming cytoskeletal protein [Rhodocyclales bacterium]|nr:polymer-forming cytoskeletal protein [Rhodocyclales bacterium]